MAQLLTVLRSPAARYLHYHTLTPREQVCMKHDTQNPLSAVGSQECPGEKHEHHVRVETIAEHPRERKGTPIRMTSDTQWPGMGNCRTRWWARFRCVSDSMQRRGEFFSIMSGHMHCCDNRLYCGSSQTGHPFKGFIGCSLTVAGLVYLAQKTNKQKIGHHARPRRASATAPLRTGADMCRTGVGTGSSAGADKGLDRRQSNHEWTDNHAGRRRLANTDS